MPHQCFMYSSLERLLSLGFLLLQGIRIVRKRQMVSLLIGLLMGLPSVKAQEEEASPMKYAKDVDFKKELTFKNARIRPAKKNQSTAGFVEISNSSRHDLQIIKVECPLARINEMHISIEENNVHKMRPLTFITLDKGDTTVLKPGGLHIMLMGLQQDFIEGQNIELTFTFDNGAKVTVPFVVQPVCEKCHEAA